MSTPTPTQILATPMGDSDINAATIGDYLIELLATVWRKGSDFSGKRPFGNSGWQWDVYAALARAGHVAGSFDEDGYLNDDVETHECDQLIEAAIMSLGEVAE